MTNKINVGDIVTIYYSDEEIVRDVKVLHVPQDTGDMWYFESEHEIIAQNPVSSNLDVIIKKKEQ